MLEQDPNLSAVPREIVPEPDQVAIAAETLKDPGATAQARAEAAGFLLQRGDEGWEVLSASLAEDAVRAAVLEAARARPERVLDLLARDDAVIDDPFRVALIESLKGERSPEVARALIHELEAEGTRQASFGVLCGLTGRADLGPDPSAWAAWQESVQDLSPEAWRERLVSDLVARVARLDERASLAERMLADAYRRLYLLTDAAGRPALLAELLRWDQHGLQSLGFELAERELTANADLNSEVAQAAIGLLDAPDVHVRARAARLVNRLAPPSAGAVVARVLAAETDPIAAEPLLQAAARWPSPDLVEPVLRWLMQEQTREAACQAAVALYDAGLLVGDDPRERLRAVLTPIPENASAARLILLAQAGTAADREAIAALLHKADETGRLAAADALARSSAGAALLVDAATRDPTLAPDALIALARHNRVESASEAIAGMDAWAAAFERSTAAGVRATIAGRILTLFDDLLSPEQKVVYEAAAGPDD